MGVLRRIAGTPLHSKLCLAAKVPEPRFLVVQDIVIFHSVGNRSNLRALNRQGTRVEFFTMTVQHPDEDAEIRRIKELERIEALRRLLRNQNRWRIHVG